MILKKRYQQDNGVELVISVDFNRKDKEVEKIVSCEVIFQGVVKAPITEIMYKEFGLEDKVFGQEINWWEIYRETIVAEYEAA